MLLASMPVGYGLTRRRHERWRARWRLRSCRALDDAHESDRVYATGIVRPLDETLVAPLSGRTCVAYRSRVVGGLTRLHFPGETMQLRPFVLDLGDEEIVVAGEHAIFGLPPLPLAPRDPEREASFAARHALPSRPDAYGFPTAGTHARFSEVALEPGARVAVGGTLLLVPPDEPPADGELGFREPPPPERRIVGNRAHPLVFADIDAEP
jgi:hypothetical protein